MEMEVEVEMKMQMQMLELELKNMNLICGKRKLERIDNESRKAMRSDASGWPPGYCIAYKVLYYMVWGPAGNLGWLGWIIG